MRKKAFTQRENVAPEIFEPVLARSKSVVHGNDASIGYSRKGRTGWEELAVAAGGSWKGCTVL